MLLSRVNSSVWSLSWLRRSECFCFSLILLILVYFSSSLCVCVCWLLVLVWATGIRVLFLYTHTREFLFSFFRRILRTNTTFYFATRNTFVTLLSTHHTHQYIYILDRGWSPRDVCTSIFKAVSHPPPSS